MGTAPPSVQVIESVARKADVSPTEVSPTLYEILDPDAVDALFSNTTRDSGAVELTFEYPGYEVRVVGCDTTDVTVCIEETSTAQPQNMPDQEVESSNES